MPFSIDKQLTLCFKELHYRSGNWRHKKVLFVVPLKRHTHTHTHTHWVSMIDGKCHRNNELYTVQTVYSISRH